MNKKKIKFIKSGFSIYGLNGLCKYTISQSGKIKIQKNEKSSNTKINIK